MIAINPSTNQYECGDPRVVEIRMHETPNQSPPIFTLELWLTGNKVKQFGGKPFSYTDDLIKEAEEWLATLPAPDRAREGQ